MRVEKAIKKAAHKLLTKRQMYSIPTSYLITYILEEASSHCAKLRNTIASAIPSKVNTTMREIRVYKDSIQITVFLIPGDTQLFAALSSVGKMLTEYFDDKEETAVVQPVLFDDMNPLLDTPSESNSEEEYRYQKEISNTYWSKKYPKKLHFDPIAWKKFNQVLDHMAGLGYEVGFLGFVKEEEDTLLLYDIDIPEQTVHAVSYNIPAASRFKIKNAEDCNCMLHSHREMGVFFSGTDEADFVRETVYTGSNRIYVSIVGNTKRELYGKIYTGHDKKTYELDFVKPEKEVSPYVQSVLSRIKGAAYGMESRWSVPVSV